MGCESVLASLPYAASAKAIQVNCAAHNMIVDHYHLPASGRFKFPLTVG
jgi:hypothetical protein